MARWQALPCFAAARFGPQVVRALFRAFLGQRRAVLCVEPHRSLSLRQEQGIDKLLHASSAKPGICNCGFAQASEHTTRLLSHPKSCAEVGPGPSSAVYLSLESIF